MTEDKNLRIDIAQTTISEQCTNPLTDAADIVGQILDPEAVEETPEQLAERQFLEELHKTRISVSDEFPEVQNLLSIDDVGFFAMGNIHAIKAKQKNGKTNAIAIMVAAILSGQWGRLKAEVKNARVLVIDTEQSAPDTHQVYLRTLQLANLPLEDIYDRFQTYCLRSYEREDKVKALETLIKEFQPDIVFVDGVVDLMGNFNEVDESKKIIEHLVRLSTKEVSGKDIAIVCVLHTNKATDDHNMRGHAGTMLSQKASTVFEVRKDNGIFTVTNTDSRHKEVPTWSFRFDDNDNIVEADSEREAHLEQRRTAKKEAADARSAQLKEERTSALLHIVRKAQGVISRTQLRDQLIQSLNLSRSSVDTLIINCLNDKVITINVDKNVIIPQAPESVTEQQLQF